MKKREKTVAELRKEAQAEARQKPSLKQLFAEQADRFRAASIVETQHEYWDTFDRAHSRISVELCHGVWHTFYREYRGIGDPFIKAHADRESARAFARAWLETRYSR